MLSRIDGPAARGAALLVIIALSGCRGAGGTRSTDGSPIRSYVAIGGRPGAPDESRRAQRPRAISSRVDGKSNPVDRSAKALNGRVVDLDGTPVANASVRVAFDGSTGSREIRGTTDRTGSFRLAGLRPDQAYVLIAEWEGADESLVGRTRIDGSAESAEIQVDDPHRRSTRRGDDRNSDVSAREFRPEPLLIGASLDESEGEGPSTARARSPESPEGADPHRTGWQASTADDLLGRDVEADREEAEPGFELAAGGMAGSTDRNPLPPALERVDPAKLPSSEALEPLGEPDLPLDPQSSASDLDPVGRPATPADPALVEPDPPAEFMTEPAETSPPMDAGATPVEPVEEQQTGEDSLVPAQPVDVSEPSRLPDDPFFEPEPSSADPNPGQAESIPSLTWNDLPPPGEALVAESLTTPAPARRPSLAGLRDRLIGSNGDAIVASCRFDPRRQQLSDFTLPDLQGRAFRRADVDSDLMLLAFWGSWSDTCLQAVGHLDELQQYFDPAHLQVIAVAYEKIDPETRAIELEALSRRLGLGFPILVGPTDGTCPLQKALNVQFYPTFVLVDRYGRIQWRATGGTGETLMRLDRAVNSAVQRASELRTAGREAIEATTTR